MEARKGGIRTLPPEIPDRTEEDRRSSRVRWVPAALAAAGLIGFGVVSGVLAGSLDATTTTTSAVSSAGSDTVPSLVLPGETPTTTVRVPTTTEPPTLAQIVPGLGGDIQIAAVDGQSGRGVELYWRAYSTEPLRFDRSGRSDLFQYDMSGSFGAYITFTNQDSLVTNGSVLFAGSQPDPDPVALNVRDFAWHPDQPGLLAFVAGPQPGEPAAGGEGLYVAGFGLAGLLEPPVRVADVGALSQIHGWGEWGFIVSSWPVEAPQVVYDTTAEGFQEIRYTTLIDPDGAVVARAALDPEAVGGDGTMVARDTSGALRSAGIEPSDLGLQEPAGQPRLALYTASFEPIETAVTLREESTYLLGAGLVIQAYPSSGGTSLGVQPIDTSFTRSISLPGQLELRGTTSSLVVLTDPAPDQNHAGSVYLVDPNTGQTWRLRMPDSLSPLDAVLFGR